MSRRNSRNKPSGVNSNRKHKSRNEIKMINLPVLVGILLSVICLLVVSIRSCSNLRGALTMMNPNMMPGQKGMPGMIPHMNPNKGPFMSTGGNASGGARVKGNAVKKTVGHHQSTAAPSHNPRKETFPHNQLHESFVTADGTTRVNDHELRLSREHEYGHDVNSSSMFGGTTSTQYYFYNSHSGTFHLKEEFATYPSAPVKTMVSSNSKYYQTSFQSALSLSGKYLPSLCKNGRDYGFSDLNHLRNAIEELSSAYADAVERYLHQKRATEEYEAIVAAMSSDIIQIPPPLPQYIIDFLEVTPDPFVICPYAQLRPTVGRHGPLYINAEEVVVECDSCAIDAPSSHFSFGPLAKSAVVRGITLMGATDTSVIFRQDGAEVLFEDCVFIRNSASMPAHGAVADINANR